MQGNGFLSQAVTNHLICMHKEYCWYSLLGRCEKFRSWDVTEQRQSTSGENLTPPHFHKFKYKSEDYLIYSLTVKIWLSFIKRILFICLPLLSMLYIIRFTCAQEDMNWVTKADYLLDVALSPPGVEACSGSWLTRQVGKEQPSPKLENSELVSYVQNPTTLKKFFLFITIYYFKKTNHPPNTLHPDHSTV